MSDTSETSAIDDKKNSSSSGNNPKSETSTFFGALIYQLFYLFIVIIAGGAMLWSAKVSQTNLMPNDLKCEPFTYAETKLNGGVNPVANIDVVKMRNDAGMDEIRSTKLEFPIEENMNIVKFGICGLESIREWTDGPDSTPFTLYLGTIWQKMAANYSNMMTTFYNILNQTCNESVIIFIMPFIIIFVLFVVGVINQFYGILLWFTSLHLLFSLQKGCFKEKKLDINGKEILINRIPVETTRKIWEYKSGDMAKHWFWSIVYIIAAFMSVGWIGYFTTFYFLIRSAFSALFLPFCMTAHIKDDGVNSNADKKEYTFSTLLKNILKYKMSVIMYIVSFFIIGDANAALGTLGAFIAIVACFFIYSFYPDIYRQMKPDKDNTESTLGLASYKQANKTCEIKKDEGCVFEQTQDETKTWLQSLISIFFSPEPAKEKATSGAAIFSTPNTPVLPSAPPVEFDNADITSQQLVNNNVVQGKPEVVVQGKPEVVVQGKPEVVVQGTPVTTNKGGSRKRQTK